MRWYLLPTLPFAVHTVQGDASGNVWAVEFDALGFALVVGFAHVGTSYSLGLNIPSNRFLGISFAITTAYCALSEIRILNPA
jgi:hypothetical protein